jgi:hypothetical protein
MSNDALEIRELRFEYALQAFGEILRPVVDGDKDGNERAVYHTSLAR